ncbi:MAG: diaminopimelate decarboxylase [Rhodospirillaceae bacterium]|nr:diaminopimelate decarboxylase [Rhodospirillaceae bacterium]
MNHFEYKNGHLTAEDVRLGDIAAEIGTPFYAYSTATLSRHYQIFADALRGMNALVCFAVKANSNIAVIRSLARLGAGADVVSGGELTRALKAGVPAAKIIFSGVGKTDEELSLALSIGIKQINVESVPELEAISRIASANGVVAPVALRINPDIDAGTHAKITTGTLENKFGIEWTLAHEVYSRASQMPGIEVKGLAVHIGSQLHDLEPFRKAYERMGDLVAMILKDGLNIETLDLGGGFGIPYGDETAPVPNVEEYAQIVRETLGNLGPGLDIEYIFEPGRMIAGNAGVLVSSVIYVKEGATRNFVIVDAAMNDLIRPTLYGAYHEIVPVDEPGEGVDVIEADVVGPICETGDIFAKAKSMPRPRPGDLLAVRTAGAYGAVQSSTYNTRPLVAEVLVNGDKFHVIRPRLGVEEIISRESIAPWQLTD